VGDQLSILLAIAAMAAVTIACRCGGYFLFARVEPSPLVRRALAYLPGCIFAAYVVPALIAGPPGNWIGAAATMLTMWRTRNLGVSIAAGVACGWGARVWL
jgi:uncharacterized membrane protein